MRPAALDFCAGSTTLGSPVLFSKLATAERLHEPSDSASMPHAWSGVVPAHHLQVQAVSWSLQKLQQHRLQLRSECSAACQ